MRAVSVCPWAAGTTWERIVYHIRSWHRQDGHNEAPHANKSHAATQQLQGHGSIRLS